jgi:uncharacterized protein (TIRG00374 family)
VKTALRWGGSLVLVAFLVAWLDWGKVSAAFARLRIELWALAALLYLVCQVLSSLRWRILATVLGFRGSTSKFTGVYFIGSFFNLILPTSVGGDVVRVWYLSGMPCASQTGRTTLAAITVLVDRVSGLMILVGIACVATLISPVALPSWVNVTVAVTGVGMVAGLTFLLVGGCVARSVLQRLPGGLQVILVRLLTAARLYLRHPWALLSTSLLSVAVQGVNVVLVWCIGLGLGLDVPLVCYGVIVPLTTLLTLVPISLNGIGLREGGYVLLMRPLGVSAPSALALAFLLFLATTACSLVGLGFYLFGRYPRYRPTLTEETDHERSLSGDPDQGRGGESAAAA